MSLIHTLYRVPGLTPWGIFHNLDTDESVRYVFIHFAGRQVGLLWGGDESPEQTVAERGVW